jgi:hypothetical protein
MAYITRHIISKTNTLAKKSLAEGLSGVAGFEPAQHSPESATLFPACGLAQENCLAMYMVGAGGYAYVGWLSIDMEGAGGVYLVVLSTSP